MKVTFFYRPKIGAHSIEAVFEIIKKALPADVDYKDYICTQKWKRFHSFFKAVNYQGDVNHITGDVHTLALFLNPKKTIITVHDIGRYERDLRGIKKKLVKLLWLTLPLKRAAIITTISEFTRDKLINICNISPDKIRLIPNPAAEDFNYVPRNFNSESPVILQIGGGNNKNIFRLAKAIQGTKFRLLLIRKPDASIKAMLDELNIEYEWKANISREEVFKCYQNCDIVFFASEYEGFGVPIIEANIVGRPVITSNIASMPSVAGDAAVLIDPFSIEDIRSGLFKITENQNLRKDLVEAGLKNVKRFSKEVIAMQYYEVYKEIIQGKK